MMENICMIVLCIVLHILNKCTLKRYIQLPVETFSIIESIYTEVHGCVLGVDVLGQLLIVELIYLLVTLYVKNILLCKTL